jgi:hypothetical protein
MQFTAKVKGDLLQRLENRSRRWTASRHQVILRVPPELSWWYWQEFGTAASGEEGRSSGHTYRIVPVNARVLSWPDGQGGRVVRAEVPAHPGIKPRRAVRQVLPDIREEMASAVHQAFLHKAVDDPTRLSASFVTAMEDAKKRIVESMQTQIPGTRQDGKLAGRSASQEFNDNAEVVDLSD